MRSHDVRAILGPVRACNAVPACSDGSGRRELPERWLRYASPELPKARPPTWLLTPTLDDWKDVLRRECEMTWAAIGKESLEEPALPDAAGIGYGSAIAFKALAQVRKLFGAAQEFDVAVVQAIT